MMPREITHRDSIKLLSLLLAKIAAEGSDAEVQTFALAINDVDLPDSLLNKYMDPQWKTQYQ